MVNITIKKNSINKMKMCFTISLMYFQLLTLMLLVTIS